MVATATPDKEASSRLRPGMQELANRQNQAPCGIEQDPGLLLPRQQEKAHPASNDKLSSLRRPWQQRRPVAGNRFRCVLLGLVMLLALGWLTFQDLETMYSSSSSSRFSVPDAWTTEATSTPFSLLKPGFDPFTADSSKVSSAGQPAATPLVPTTFPDASSLSSSATLLTYPTSAEKHLVLRWRDGEINDKSALEQIPVVVWPFAEFGALNAAAKHIEADGLQQSPFFDFRTNMSDVTGPNLVWVADAGNSLPRDGQSVRWCNDYEKRVRVAIQQRQTLGLSTSWPIFILDWSDLYKTGKCENLESLMGKEYVFYSKRSIVRQRLWREQKDWVSPGFKIQLQDEHRHYKHTPMSVRTDTVQCLQDVLKEAYNLTIQDPIEDLLPRPVDVSHFWPVNRQGVGTVESLLRTKVSRILETMTNETSPRDSTATSSSNINAFVGLAGASQRVGRRGVQSVYLEGLARSKIVVIVQRDSWEDHYRLFEGLVSGAMVMTDRMLSLPAGLKNGTSLIEFQNEEELRWYLLYYLSHDDERRAIASRGRKISMARHRSWHRMEEVVFGTVMSTCPDENDDVVGDNRMNEELQQSCPFTVNAGAVDERPISRC